MIHFYSTTIRDLATVLERYNGFTITGKFGDNQRIPVTYHLCGDDRRISVRQRNGLEAISWSKGKVTRRYAMDPRRKLNMTYRDFNIKREEEQNGKKES